jgi:hypothetical protein
MSRVRVLVLALSWLALLAPSVAAESPRSMMFEIHVGPYEPQIDRAFKYSTPYADLFGDETMLMFGFHADYQLFQDFGAVAIGGGARLGWVDGLALNLDGTASSDPTTLHVLPLTASVTYRFDWMARNWGLPIVPYGKVGLTYTVWWVLNGNSEIANTYDLDDVGRAGQGGTFGFHAAGGIQVLLDWFGPGLAAEFDTEIGVNNSYLFFEYGYHNVNDFGSASSFDLGDATFSAGMMFEL